MTAAELARAAPARALLLSAIALLALTGNRVHAHGDDPHSADTIGDEAAITSAVVSSSALPNLPGQRLTAVTVELAPGAAAAPHHHAGFVFVYVLSGTVRSQLNDGAVIDYPADASWVEPPGTTHTLTANPSTSEPTRILAVFVAGDSEELTRPGAATAPAKQ